MSRNPPRRRDDPRGFPRVSGDEPLIDNGEGVERGFSPRERG